MLTLLLSLFTLTALAIITIFIKNKKESPLKSTGTYDPGFKPILSIPGLITKLCQEEKLYSEYKSIGSVLPLKTVINYLNKNYGKNNIKFINESKSKDENKKFTKILKIKISKTETVIMLLNIANYSQEYWKMHLKDEEDKFLLDGEEIINSYHIYYNLQTSQLEVNNLIEKITGFQLKKIIIPVIRKEYPRLLNLFTERGMLNYTETKLKPIGKITDMSYLYGKAIISDGKNQKLVYLPALASKVVEAMTEHGISLLISGEAGVGKSQFAVLILQLIQQIKETTILKFNIESSLQLLKAKQINSDKKQLNSDNLVIGLIDQADKKIRENADTIAELTSSAEDTFQLICIINGTLNDDPVTKSLVRPGRFIHIHILPLDQEEIERAFNYLKSSNILLNNKKVELITNVGQATLAEIFTAKEDNPIYSFFDE